MFIKNSRMLRTRFPHIIAHAQQPRYQHEYVVQTTASGHPSILYRSVYMHSRYNPTYEAERFVEQYQPEDVQAYRYVFFYGVGMGYHIEAFARKFPDKELILYEPESAVLHYHMHTRSVRKLPLKQIKKWFVETEDEKSGDFLLSFEEEIKTGKVLFITLPIYAQLFPERHALFLKRVTAFVQDKNFWAAVTNMFEKLWVVNSLLNLPRTLETPSIFDFTSVFANKPAIIAAAGPSLEDELENLRPIKAEGTAYIFAVGSSVHTLLKHGIHPDAVFVYDPKPSTKHVVEEIVQKNITHIPLVYGTTVGYETLQNYPGPLLHIIMDKDTVAPELLRRRDGFPLACVQDAPSIAVIALQVLMKLGCRSIYLVGQNLAYRGSRFYAGGIPYYSPDMNEDQQKQAVSVRDVYGNEILTHEGFNRMRWELEEYIALHPQCEVINTTKDGAHIQGARFMTLEEVMTSRLVSRVVEEGWCVREASIYDREFAAKKRQELVREYEALIRILQKIAKQCGDLAANLHVWQPAQIQKQIERIDKEFRHMGRNMCFRVCLLPMNQVAYEGFVRQMRTHRFESDVRKKANALLELFSRFLEMGREDLQLLSVVF